MESASLEALSLFFIDDFGRVFVDNNNYKCYYVDVDESRINPS